MYQRTGRTIKKPAQRENEENRAKGQAGAEKERHGKKQLDIFPKEESSTNISEKEKRMVKKERISYKTRRDQRR